MKIAITGAEMVKVNNEYQVIYNGQIVFTTTKRDVALTVALNTQNLVQLSNESNQLVA